MIFLIVKIFVLLVMVVMLAIDMRTMILMYRSKNASEKQKERLREQMKEIASL